MSDNKCNCPICDPKEWDSNLDRIREGYRGRQEAGMQAVSVYRLASIEALLVHIAEKLDSSN